MKRVQTLCSPKMRDEKESLLSVKKGENVRDGEKQGEL
jgi:hypothetical protein